MTVIEIKTLKGTIGTVTVANGRAVYSGDKVRRLVAGLYVPDPDNPSRPLTPSDGDRWLARLPAAIRGVYVWAEPIVEEPEP